jgi:hypothetical protein
VVDRIRRRRVIDQVSPGGALEEVCRRGHAALFRRVRRLAA